MLTKDAARVLAETHLSEISTDVELYDEPVHEGEYGWVFSYQSKKYLQSEDISDALAGNAPLLIDRHSSKIQALGTGQSVEFYVRNYIEFGDPFKTAGSCIELTDWKTGAEKVKATRLIRSHTCLGLRDAKCVVDECLEGNAQMVECSSVSDAQQLVAELEDIGFIAKQLAA